MDQTLDQRRNKEKYIKREREMKENEKEKRGSESERKFLRK